MLNLKNLNKVIVNEERTTSKSVFIDNFIDHEYGNTKIYKAKKRLELRLHPKKWIDSGAFVKITTSFISKHVNLREKSVGTKYLKKSIEDLEKIKIKFVK